MLIEFIEVYVCILNNFVCFVFDKGFFGDCKLYNDWMIYLYYVDYCMSLFLRVGFYW